MLSNVSSRRWKRMMAWAMLPASFFFLLWLYFPQSSVVQLPEKFMYPAERGSPVFSQVESAMMRHLERNASCKWHLRYTTETLPTCSFSIIKDYMTECGYFPQGLTLTEHDEPVLKFCKLPETNKEAVLSYLHKYVKNIVSMGDSQGARYSGWMIGKLKEFGLTCDMTKGEPVGFKGRKDYFFSDPETNRALIDPERKCRTCTSFKRRCVVPPVGDFTQPKEIYFEYISMIMHNINTTMVNATYCASHPEVEVCEYRTLADIIFKYYLRDAYPELLILFPTFAHDIGVALAETVPNLGYMNALIGRYFPAKTQVVWLPAAFANYRRFPVGTLQQGEGINARIDLLNHWLFESITTASYTTPTLHGYFDIGEIGRIREMEWADDFIHFLPPYYKVVANTMLALIPSLEQWLN